MAKTNGETLLDCAAAEKETPAGLRRKRLHFGLVFQNFNLFPQYTALENVALASLLQEKKTDAYKRDKRGVTARIEEDARGLLRQMGLGDRENNYPHQLSGGHRAGAGAAAGHPLL